MTKRSVQILYADLSTACWSCHAHSTASLAHLQSDYLYSKFLAEAETPNREGTPETCIYSATTVEPVTSIATGKK